MPPSMKVYEIIMFIIMSMGLLLVWPFSASSGKNYKYKSNRTLFFNIHHDLRTDDELQKFATYKYIKHKIIHMYTCGQNNDNTFSLVPQLKYPHKAKCFFVGLYLRLWRNTATFLSLDGTPYKETTNTESTLENLVYLK